jgi:hypothetical protein
MDRPPRAESEDKDEEEVTLETRLLQLCIFLAASVAVLAGLGGALEGARFFDLSGDVSASSNVHYLSGLLFAIGLTYWSTIPNIATSTSRFRMLSVIVICGGLFRFLAIFTHGMPHGWALFGLVNETLVPLALLLWQTRIAGKVATP